MAENVTPTRGKPVEDKANCSPFDLGVLFEELRQFSDQRKFELINNVWRPGSTFLFPKTKESGRNRRFNSSWLQDFPWLVYSRYLDGAFCLPCVLFARQCGRNSAKLDKLVKSPLTFWTTAFNRLSNHANGKCSTHNLSVIAMNNFVRVMKQEETNMPFVTFTPYCNCLPLCLCHQPPLRDLFPHSNTSRLTFVTPWAKSD